MNNALYPFSLFGKKNRRHQLQFFSLAMKQNPGQFRPKRRKKKGEISVVQHLSI